MNPPFERKTAFNNSRLPVPVENLQAENRLVILLHEIERIASIAKKEQDLRKHNKQVIRDAIVYTPGFAMEIATALKPLGQLLIENGFKPEKDEKEQTLKKAVGDVLGDLSIGPKVKDPESVRRDIVRETSKAVHPDIATPHDIELQSVGDRNSVLAKVLNSVRDEESEIAQQVLLETMPQYLFNFVQSLLKEGRSFSEIVEAYPRIVPQMEHLRYVAEVRLPKPRVYRRFGTKEAADREAERIRRNKDYHARTEGFSYIYKVASGILTVGRTKGMTNVEITEYESLLSFTERIYGYIGGTGEFIRQRGDWIVTPYAHRLSQQIDDIIRTLPEKLLAIAQALVSSRVTPTGILALIDKMRQDITTINSRAHEFGNILENQANRRPREDKNIIFNSRFNNKENKY